jgi:hypothetical protein
MAKAFSAPIGNAAIPGITANTPRRGKSPMPAPHPLLKYLLISLLFAVPSARAEDAKEIVQSLFGDKIKEVARTSSKLDDVKLAGDMFAAAKEAQEEISLLQVLCPIVYDLASKHATGHEIAVEAMSLLAEKDPKSARDALKKIILIRTRLYRYGKRDLRGEFGNMLIDDHLALAAAEENASNMNGAASQLYASVSVARTIKSDRLQNLLATQTAFNARKQVHGRVNDFLAKIKANPKDTVAAKQLVLLYVTELDEVEKARKYTFLLADKELGTRVTLANRPLEDLAELEAFDLAQWYFRLSGGVRTTLKPLLLSHAKTYFERFLELHDTSDLKTKTAQLTLKSIEKTLKDLGTVATIARKKATRRSSPGVIRYVGKPITLEAERAGKIVGGNMKLYKDGKITYLSVKERPGDDSDHRRGPSKSRLLILIQVPKPIQVRLHANLNTPSAGSGNNSFYVAAVPGKKADAPKFVHWEGPTKPEWTWMTMRKSLTLAKGLNTIIIGGRELGAMIDKIRISPLEGE